MRFEWDPAKRQTNLRRHGVDFSIVHRIFEGPFLEWQDDRYDYAEIRWFTIGIVNGTELTVCYTDRGQRRSIISARRANSMSVTPTTEPSSPEAEPLPDKDLTDWALLREMSDEEIDARAGDDPDAQPTGADFWKDARVTLPPGKTRVFLDLDDDVLAWFKAHGKAYGQSMNEALRAFVERQRGQSRAASEIAEPGTFYDGPDREPTD